MATISVDQYNDDGTTSRTAGEVLTINGATFTQRTDTRWHATAPASMTGDYSDKNGNCRSFQKKKLRRPCRPRTRTILHQQNMTDFRLGMTTITPRTCYI